MTLRWRQALLAATLGYLAIEIAFTSYLIEFLGSAPATAEIHRVEQFGRSLTGVALALFVIPLVIPRLPVQPIFRVVAACVLAIGCVGLAHQAINALVEGVTGRTSIEARRAAVLVNAGVDRIHTLDGGQPVLAVDGVHLPTALKTSVEGRVALAALPFLLAHAPRIEERLRAVLARLTEDEVRTALPTAESLFNQVMVPLTRDYLAGLYSGYVQAANAARTARTASIRESDLAWDRYLRQIGPFALPPDAVAERPRLRQIANRELRKSNPKIPEGWVPLRREDFDDLAMDEIRKDYRAALVKIGLNRSAYVELDAFEQDILPETFFAHAHPRALWAAKVRDAVKEPVFRDHMLTFGPAIGRSEEVFPRFRAVVFDPVLGERTQGAMGRLDASVAAFAQDGAHGAEGYEAMKVLVVIPIAILFSMIGALTHGLKVAWLGMAVAGVPRRVAVVAIAMVAVGIGALGLAGRGPEVLRRDEVQVLMRNLEDATSMPMAKLASFTMNIQPRLYPIGRTLRRA